MSEQKRGIKGRVYLSDEQVLAAGHQFGCGRFVYNRLLGFSQERYFTDKTKTSPKDRSLELTRLKTELPWLREVNAQSLQQTGRAFTSRNHGNSVLSRVSSRLLSFGEVLVLSVKYRS